MAFFLKTSHYKKGDYLQIYESFRDPVSHQPRNKCVKTLGYVCDLISSGIPDPVTFYKDEVAKMNDERKNERERKKAAKLSGVPPVRHLGYFPLNAILNRMGMKPLIDLFDHSRNFDFPVYDVLKALAFSRAINPCSKRKTLSDVLPLLWDHPDVSYDQILECLEFCGNQYEKFVELFTAQTSLTYMLDTSTTYFDCTNFYFEIDREDEWRKKGPSKENRKDPILGMGLLLDANCIPIGMKLFPGNQSEKPVIRDIITDLKRRGNIQGKTVQVADKGLNCARNIIEAVEKGDGYLFSRSVKNLNEVEKKWVFSDEGWSSKTDANGSIKYEFKSCVDDFVYTYTDENGRKYRKTVREKRLVTYNPSLARKQRLELEKMAEKARRLCVCQAKKSEYGESSKYVDFLSEDQETGELNKKATAVFNEDKLAEDKEKCGFNMLVTSEYKLDCDQIYDTYHRLWRIEETFRAMKSELDARPVYLQNIDRIKGHFLVCYIAVLLERIFQFKTLKNKFGTEQIFEFIRHFDVVPYDLKNAMNISPNSPLLNYLAENYNLPITNARLSKTQIKRVLEANL